MAVLMMKHRYIFKYLECNWDTDTDTDITRRTRKCRFGLACIITYMNGRTASHLFLSYEVRSKFDHARRPHGGHVLTSDHRRLFGITAYAKQTGLAQRSGHLDAPRI